MSGVLNEDRQRLGTYSARGKEGLNTGCPRQRHSNIVVVIKVLVCVPCNEIKTCNAQWHIRRGLTMGFI